ncbi:hypothetical protein FORC47_p088 (plasmid) [Bacillus cereus]|nr:hypothetical protein FORC47_p088 [Bacillus cereus]
MRCWKASISMQNKSSSFAKANKEQSHERPSGKEIGTFLSLLFYHIKRCREKRHVEWKKVVFPFSKGLKNFLL